MPLKFWVLVNFVFIFFRLAQPLLYPDLGLLPIIIRVHGYGKQRGFQVSPFCLFLEDSFGSEAKRRRLSPWILA